MAATPLYVGTYTDGASQGIYRVEFDVVSGRLSSPSLAAPRTNPTFLAWHPSLPVMYAVSETNAAWPDGTGGVAAYAVEPHGHLRLLNEVSSGGAGPCYVSATRSGGHVLVANYGGGSVAVLPVRGDGGLLGASCVVQHRGAGPHVVRQPGPRAHAIVESPGGRFVLAADLGADRVFVYRLEPDTGTLTRAGQGDVATTPGGGPRHLTWNHSGDVCYLVNELDSTVGVYAWDESRSTLTLRGTASTLSAGWTGESTAAHIAMHPSGRALYVSNRGHDSLAHLTLDASGDVVAVETYPSGGQTPRHFGVDAAHGRLIVANQDSNTVVVVTLEGPTGIPVLTGERVEVPTPSFVLMPY